MLFVTKSAIEGATLSLSSILLGKLDFSRARREAHIGQPRNLGAGTHVTCGRDQRPSMDREAKINAAAVAGDPKAPCTSKAPPLRVSMGNTRTPRTLTLQRVWFRRTKLVSVCV